MRRLNNDQCMLSVDSGVFVTKSICNVRRGGGAHWCECGENIGEIGGVDGADAKGGEAKNLRAL